MKAQDGGLLLITVPDGASDVSPHPSAPERPSRWCCLLWWSCCSSGSRWAWARGSVGSVWSASSWPSWGARRRHQPALVTHTPHAEGAFTPDANKALRVNDLHVNSMQRRDRQSCGAIHATRIERFDAWFTRVEKSELWRIFALR